MERSNPTMIEGDDQVEPEPIRVAVVDLEDGLPTLHPDDRYRRAWIVARRGEIPRAIVEVDLESPAGALDQLRRLAEEPLANTVESEAPDAELPSISVVVPSVIARVEELDRCLAAFADLDYPDFDIILVDNRRELPQDDPLPALLADRPQIRSVRAVRPGISAARNAGIEAARGDIVIFTDDDVHVDANWLRAFGRRFRAQPSLDAVTGLILPAELESPAQVYFERYYGGFSGERTFEPLTLRAGRGPLGRARVTAYNGGGKVVRRFAIYGVGAYGAGANMAFRRSTLQRLGGFDVALGTGTPARGGEDLATLIDVLWRGGEVGYEPAAVVYHKHREDYPALLHQMHGNGVGFTAMLSSLISHDPSHLLGLAAQLPLAAQRMATQSLTRLKGNKVSLNADPAAPQEPLYPRAMVRRELRGLTQGVPAYVRSRRLSSRWLRSQGH